MEDRNEVHPRGLRDAITAAPLHKTKHVSIKSPDGTLTLYYNTCTLIKIGQENNGRMMQPPHFREVMSEELLHEVEEAEGRTIRFINNFDDNKYDENVQHDHNYSGDDHLSVAVYNMIDYGEHGTSQLGLADRGRLPFFRVGGVIMGDAVERQLQLLDRHLEHYNVNRADLYLCPHCFEFITEKVTESRRKEANNNTTSSAAASTIDKNKPTEPTFDPLDILSTVNLKLQLPLIAFRYAKDWKAHLRLAHGYEKKNTSSALRGTNNTQNIYEYDLSPEEHRIRDHINRFLSLKNVKFFHERRFCKGISTTNSYWKSNGKYNTMRYNRIVEVCERAAMTSEGGEKITPVKKGRKGAERECEREILLVGPGYDGFGQGEKVIVQHNTNDLQRDYDDDDEMKSITTSFGIPVVNLKRSRQYLTQQEIRTLVAFEDLPSMYEDEGEDDVNAFSGDEVKKSKTNKKSKNGKKQNKEALIVDDDDFDEDEESDSSTSSSDSSSSSSSSSASDNLPVNKEEEALIALLEQEVEEHREKQRKRKEERAHLISLKEEQDRLYKNNKEVPEDISPGEKRRRSIRIILDSDQENDEEHDLKDCGENESNIGLISQKPQDCLKSKSINVDLPTSIAGTPGSEVRNTNPTTTGTSPLSSGTTIAGVSSSGSDGLTGTNKGKRSRISIDDDVVVKKERGSLRIGSILTTIPGLSLNPLAQLDPKEKEYSELLEAHEKRSHNEILEKEERMDDTYDDDRISNNLLGDSQLTENETYSNSNISISDGEEEKIRRRSNSSSSSQSSSTGSSLSCRPRGNNNLTSEKRIFLQREAERLGRRNIQNTKEDWTRHSTASSSLKGKGKSSSIQQYFPPLIPHSTTPGKDPTHRIRTFDDSDTTLQQTKITSFVGKRSSKGTGRQRDQQMGAATFIRDHAYGHSSRGNKGNEEFQSLLSYGQEKLGEYEDSSSSSSTTSSSVGDDDEEEEENDDGIDTMPGLDQVIQQFKTSDNQNKPVVIKKKK